MNKLAKARLAFLRETCSHFNSTNRATFVDPTGIGSSNCRYSHDFNGGCAIGRKCNPQLAAKLDSAFDSRGVGQLNIKSIYEQHIELYNQIPNNIRILGVSFLWDIQGLHDCQGNWTPTGLSEYGIKEMEDIIKIYNLTDE